MPADLSFLKTLDQANARPHATPKHEIATRMDHAKEKKDADRLDKQKLAVWSRQVKDRDEWKDRKTGKAVKRTTHVLHPDAAHAHHVEDRENVDVRYDIRNGVTLSAETHDAVERNKLRIVGTRFFKVNGARYIDCTHKLKFVEVK